MENDIPHYRLKRLTVLAFTILSQLGLLALAVYIICLLTTEEFKNRYSVKQKANFFVFVAVNLLIHLLGFFAVKKENLKTVKMYAFLLVLATFFMFIRVLASAFLWFLIVFFAWDLLCFISTCLYIRDLKQLYE